MTTIRNPILPGFHPDPSICRVGDDFYIANSTFEWFPGVTIHQSRDLAHWQPVARPLDRLSQLDMIGNPDSGGIWAPCLSFADGLFWLIYTDVKSLSGPYKDAPNYLVTAPEITGPWSEPVYLNSSGFDPSLFHDDDGRKWLVNMVWDHRPGRDRFRGIDLQEYDPAERTLIGEPAGIFERTDLGCTEGPHLYSREGAYYLMLAEGGTGYEHAVTIARSTDIDGPYEVDPDYPMLTAKGTDATLQKAGHASLTDTPSGEWYLVHLVGRPVNPDAPDNEKRCPLGRETAIQKVVWTDDGWLRLETGGNTPLDEVPAPDLPPRTFEQPPLRHTFETAALPIEFQSLRVPIDESWASLTERPGFLRLRGRESLASRHHQSLIARRVEHLPCHAATAVEFEPRTFQQMAGLVAYYNTGNWAYLHVSEDQGVGRVLRLGVCENSRYTEPMEPIHVGARRRTFLRVTFESDATMRFYTGSQCSGGDVDWMPVGPQLDGSKLSDEYVQGWGFTGTFVGMACQDLAGRGAFADFEWFEYRPEIAE
jgi:xylan 1,4-beta-xylosidase